MDHRDHVSLIKEGVEGQPGEWADLGSGGGAFTLALAELLGSDGRIHSVDRDGHALGRQRRLIEERFPDSQVSYLQADFGRPLELPPLDGVVMANSLHFIRRKAPVLDLVRSYLKPGGRLVLVEYDSDRGNPWVPHPLSYPSWERLSSEAGFEQTRLLKRVPSGVMGAIYSASSRRPRPEPSKPR
ncbi:MAG: class I SAM-dependent methyltransferase [Candidatus Nephthysia bennettiae]|uniref:Class I SAM-dependent methyltransferase n=1 Tax=Candidatus Nephthysia bennettiae TaxID=3127016 RepID=A0A934K9E0_9BACT|nr:class I SAM-dependent methyltransferase [Candidatus Dormibacteraeota bacterium]MBJ7612156.1 class I SAM-dependent methyltransferase [Candidatus Dormibacteraeota bacterium]PZR66406.1 MAG: class I SAM-dependent methyltransferase [Candidatus Dormibacteraeota bacterium]PZR97716.1 MAG: class I SAM-dependent methyltransferase [Candidatus Dormibacteraeota bacterium]